MKVLQINVVYKNGSTGKIVQDIHKQLIARGNESLVCYGRGKRIYEKGVYKAGPEFLMKLQSLQSRITGYAYAGCYLSTRKLIKIMNIEKPDVVHLQCINGYFVNIYKLLEHLKKNNIKTVLTLHAEFMYTAGCGHAFDCGRWKTGCFSCPQHRKGRPTAWFFDRSKKEWLMMKEAFYGFDNLVICSVSRWLQGRAEQSPFFQGKRIVTINNGVDTSVFRRRYSSALRERLNTGENKIILHVTPNFMSKNKGGEYVLAIAKQMQLLPVRIIIVGFSGEKNALPDNVIPIEHVSNQNELAEYYSLADVTLITSQRETFSMVCAESLCCGTPVVGFKAGAPEVISIPQYSTFVTYNEVEELVDAINGMLTLNLDRSEIEDKARKEYSNITMCDKYMHLYRGAF